MGCLSFKSLGFNLAAEDISSLLGTELLHSVLKNIQMSWTGPDLV